MIYILNRSEIKPGLKLSYKPPQNKGETLHFTTVDECYFNVFGSEVKIIRSPSWSSSLSIVGVGFSSDNTSPKLLYNINREL